MGSLPEGLEGFEPLLDGFLPHDVVPLVHTEGLVACDGHCGASWDSCLFHVSYGCPPQVVEQFVLETCISQGIFPCFHKALQRPPTVRENGRTSSSSRKGREH